MLEQIMTEIRNFFPARQYSGAFVIENGMISPLSDLYDGQYYLIEGSVFNNGVHKYGDADLKDEEFNGYVTLLAPPKAFLDLVQEIEAYQTKYGETTPYTSESFGGYSYTKATGSSGAALSWTDVYGKQLNAWRKV